MSRALGLLALLELSDELSALAEPSAIAGTALLNLMGHYGCSRGALWLLSDGEACDPVLMRSQSVPPEVAAELGRHWARWFRAQGTSAPDPVVVARAVRMDPAPPGVEPALAAGLAVIAPVMAHGRVIGLFSLGTRVGGGDFGRMELEVLRASLHVLGLAAESARLRNRAVESRRQLRAVLDRPRATEPGAATSEPAVRVSRGDAKALLQTVLEERRPGVLAGLRELELSAAADVPPALLDADCALRIVDAMVDDALRRTPCGSRIRLRLESARDAEGAWVAVEVRDEGPGTTPEESAGLFAGPAARGDALGLDLPAAKRLAERMGARLEADGEIGHGTVLTLRLPAA
jgi:GAF domain-containing protein